MQKTFIAALLLIPLLSLSAVAQRRGRDGGGGRHRGFDSSAFLDRLDRNGDGVLSPEEQEGPAQFIIRRVQPVDSSIQAGNPVPVEKIRTAFEKMRQDREQGNSGENGGGRDRRRGQSSSDAERVSEGLTAKLLVPGFGDEDSDASVLGFGAAAELLTSEVTEADRSEALKRIRQYDRNKNGFLDKSEITPRFAGNPFDFDRNRDGRLSIDELAVRYARRRLVVEENQEENQNKPARRSRNDRQSAPELFGDRKSYRSRPSTDENEGVPGFLIDKDADGDGQVTMAEYSQDWNDELLAKFFEADFNQDGVITFEEGLRMAEEGPATTSSPSTSNSSPSPSRSAPTASGPIDPKYLQLAQRIIKRRDINKDGALSASEWKSMLINPVAADSNRDGKITPEEYARWTRSRALKK